MNEAVYKYNLKLVKNRGFRLSNVEIKNSYDAYCCALRMFDKEDVMFENLFMACLDSSNNLTGYVHVGTGDISNCNFNMRKILMYAVMSRTCAVVLIHNHPSGKTEPSVSDIKATINIKKLLEQIDVKLFDHVIVDCIDGNYCSFQDNGINF